jgi:ABC-type branched-subunit amino acid transport system ATPase component
MTNDLLVKKINSFYGRAHVLFDVTASVSEGRTTALLGRNGAGKTSLLRSIVSAGITTKGKIQYGDKPLIGMTTPDIARLGVQLVPEDRRIFTRLSVRQNLVLARSATTTDRPAIEIDTITDFFPMLQPLMDRSGYALSGGEQQLLAIARAMVANPTLLLLDEPSEGLAPRIVEQMGEVIQRLQKEFSLTVLMAEQNSQFALDLAQDVCVLEGGRVVLTCSTEDFKKDEVLTQRFLTL